MTGHHLVRLLLPPRRSIVIYFFLSSCITYGNVLCSVWILQDESRRPVCTCLPVLHVLQAKILVTWHGTHHVKNACMHACMPVDLVRDTPLVFLLSLIIMPSLSVLFLIHATFTLVWYQYKQRMSGLVDPEKQYAEGWLSVQRKSFISVQILGKTTQQKLAILLHVCNVLKSLSLNLEVQSTRTPLRGWDAMTKGGSKLSRLRAFRLSVVLWCVYS